MFKGGTVITGDPALGDFLRGDVLVEGSRIVAVGGQIDSDARVIEASDAIVLPGLIDSHHHFWITAFRQAIPDASGADISRFGNTVLHHLRPEDAHVAALVGGLSAINAGVTTALDYAHMSKSPAVVDACIAGHQASGLRTVYCYAETRDDTVRNYNPTDTGRTPSQPAFPGDLERLQKTYFSSRDQLLTLRLGDTRAENFALARRHGLGITCDAVFGIATPLRSNNWSPRLRQMAAQGELGPDLALIHGTGIPSDVFALLAKHGVAMILAPTSDAVLRGLGDSLTPVQQVIDHGMLERSGISTDNDVALSNELFAQMRAVFALQRALANARWQRGEADSPAPMSVRDVLTLATKGGAYAVGLGDRVGTLSPGKAADIIMIRCNDLTLGPLNNAYGSVVVGANPENVDTVMIGGQIRKRHGELVAIDQSALMRRLVASRDHIGAASGLWRPSDALGGQPAN